MEGRIKADQHPAQAESSDLGTERGVLHLGIDLGTSRCAISCSNGIREGVASVVGWPKDAIARKLRGSAPIFGDEALSHRLSLEMVYPLADGNLRYTELTGDEASRYRQAGLLLLKELVVRARARKDQLIYAVIGAPADASQRNKQAIIELAKEAGIDSVMIVSEPFAVAYGIDVLDEALIVDIGAGTIDLCRLSGTLPQPEDQYSTSKAGNHIDAELAKLVRKRYPEAQFTNNMIKRAKERYSGVLESADRAIVSFPVHGAPTDLDITQEIQSAVSLIIPEILTGIQKLVSTFDPEFQHRLRSRVYVSGGGSLIFGLQKALEDGMQTIGGGNVYLVEEPVYAGSNGALKLAREMPKEHWERLQA